MKEANFIGLPRYGGEYQVMDLSPYLSKTQFKQLRNDADEESEPPLPLDEKIAITTGYSGYKMP